ncbi:MAG: hypothetical protein M3P18_02670 [Actinomycetota bacterium]|nr:hypothetical protein [Actinomycetota bacterium]
MLGPSGSSEAGQKHKLVADALKLAWISSTIYPRSRLILCLGDAAAAAPFLPAARSWAAAALKGLGISVSVVGIPEDARRQIVKSARASIPLKVGAFSEPTYRDGHDMKRDTKRRRSGWIERPQRGRCGQSRGQRP